MQSDFTYSFHFGKASIDEEYVILSNEKIYNLPTNNIYKAIREIWKSEAIIIPKKIGDGLREP